MRNLQKILALVLALVMSLSLMATAGARDFTDGDQIDETFAESVDVLTGLEVFQGYPSGDFQPKGDITRAEVAAIIYRIATGDVTDSQVGIYADYNKFSDVPSDNWAAGYINYCANAEYIKGRGDGKFYPQDKVTGYEALAMILRVVGYDKNGEFTGADWQVQTAATANQRKVTKNVNAGTLGNPASRETVAELLCQAILIEKVNYTLAFGYQISTDPKDTIAYETFKMEKLEGVVTGNDVADLKENSPLTAGQTRLVIDGREEIVDIPTTLDKIGKSVRAYIRPQGGTTRKQLVTADVYDTELNHVYDSFAPVSSVGNSTGSEQGINSIKDAEHFVNYDFVNRWTATIRITYVMDAKWTEYEAKTMLRDNGGRLFNYANRGLASNPSNPGDYNRDDVSDEDATKWSTLLTTNADYTFTYTKTIALDEMLTNQDYNNILSIFTNADKTGTPAAWVTGEVYIGTASFNAQDDISDDIRWTDFVNTYLVNKDNRAQVESNGRGNRLIIIDNDDDGIAEYVLQTIYTIGKVSSDVKHVDTLNQKLYDSSNSDAVNSTVTSNTLVPVSGKDLAKSEDALNAGDVVIFALIDGNIRAQKAETKTEKVNTVNRAAKTITVVGEDAATYNESAVHTHSNGLKSYVNNMAGNTNYTMYFDLDGNLAAFTEGANGGLVLITNGWFNSTIGGAEYAVQAYLDGKLQTVNIGSNGNMFVRNGATGNNNWGNLRNDFGPSTVNNQTVYTINNQNQAERTGIHTIIANLDGNTLTPVDKAYLYSQNLRMLDMVGNVIPDQNNITRSFGVPYETEYSYGNYRAAYNFRGDKAILDSNGQPTTNGRQADGSYEVRGLSNTIYYVVYRGIGNDTMTRDENVVVRTYNGYGSVPDSVKNSKALEDVYAVGARENAADGTNRGTTYYAVQAVVIELGEGYDLSASEQVFVPDFSEVSNSVGIENVTMIRGNGEKEVVKVDLGNSRYFNGYDPAGSANTGNAYGNERRPGLYFMDPSDTDPEVFLLRRMTPADIRDNNYIVGYVSKSAGTMPNNYPQIEKLVRPAAYKNSWGWVNNFGSASNWTLAQQTAPDKPELAANQFFGRAVAESSKMYTYGGSTGTLLESNSYTVLGQDHHNVGTTNQSVNGLNERWDEQGPDAAGNFSFPYTNRNEVLVRYSGNKIVYAISFNETSNLNAQRVWWNCLPLDVAEADPTVPTVSFYGQPVTPDANGKFIATVPYATALANKALDPNAIVVNNGDVVPGSSNVTALADGNKTYKGTIRTEDGTYYTYELTQAGKLTVGPLKSSNEALVEITAVDTWEVIDPDKLSVGSLKKLLSADNADIHIDAKDSAGNTISEDSTDTMVGQCSTLVVYKVAKSDGTKIPTTRGTTIAGTASTITFNPDQVTVTVGGTEIANGQKVKASTAVVIRAKTGYQITDTENFNESDAHTLTLKSTNRTTKATTANAAITSAAIPSFKLTYNPDHVTVVVGSDNTVADSGAAGTAVANGANVYTGTKLRVTAKTGYALTAGASGGYGDAAYGGSATAEAGTLTITGAFEIKSEAKPGYSPAVIAAVDELEAKDKTYFTVYINGAAVSTTEHEAYNNKPDVAVGSETFWSTTNDCTPISALSKKVLEPLGYTTATASIYRGTQTVVSGVNGEDGCEYEVTAQVAILNPDKTDTGARANIKYRVIFCDVNVQNHLNEAAQWIMANRASMTSGWDSAFNTSFETANPHVVAVSGTFKMTANGSVYDCTVTLASKGNAAKTQVVEWTVAV